MVKNASKVLKIFKINYRYLGDWNGTMQIAKIAATRLYIEVCITVKQWRLKCICDQGNKINLCCRC